MLFITMTKVISDTFYLDRDKRFIILNTFLLHILCANRQVPVPCADMSYQQTTQIMKNTGNARYSQIFYASARRVPEALCFGVVRFCSGS